MDKLTLNAMIGFILAYGVVAAIMYVMNKIEAKLDGKLKVLAEEERKRLAAARAAKRHGARASAPAVGGQDAALAAAAVSAVHQFRADRS